jgi:predicted anti-sigma-YlaC factor YlaD
MPPGYESLQQLEANSVRLLAASYWPLLLAGLAVLLLSLAALWRILSRYQQGRC